MIPSRARKLPAEPSSWSKRPLLWWPPPTIPFLFVVSVSEMSAVAPEATVPLRAGYDGPPGEVSEWSKERDWKSRTC